MLVAQRLASEPSGQHRVPTLEATGLGSSLAGCFKTNLGGAAVTDSDRVVSRRGTCPPNAFAVPTAPNQSARLSSCSSSTMLGALKLNPIGLYSINLFIAALS